LRQYCRNNSGDPPWNNEIEEIVFPKVRESWLSNELYDSLPAGSDFPDAAYRERKYVLEEDQKTDEPWRVRPFRDVLPTAWQSSIHCRFLARN